jgi:hypothetical protein
VLVPNVRPVYDVSPSWSENWSTRHREVKINVNLSISPDGDAHRLAALRTALDHWPLPLSWQVNPLTDEAARRHRSWLERHALANVEDAEDPLIVLKAPRVASLAYPRADLSTLALATDWTAWFFHFDDYFDDGPLGAAEDRARQTVGFIRAVIGHPYADGVPGGNQSLCRTRDAFADLMVRTGKIMMDWQAQMFLLHLESYFRALVAEAANREHGSIPDVESYCELRRDTGPALPLLDLVEHAEGILLPRSFHGSPLFDHLMGAAADVAGWINDVFSASKERDRGDFHNLVLVTQHANKTDIIRATQLTIGKIDECLQLLERSASALDQWCLEARASQIEQLAIHRWARGLHDFLHHADWYVHHARYATSYQDVGRSTR